MQPFLSLVSTFLSAVLFSSLLSDWQAVVSKLWTRRKKQEEGVGECVFVWCVCVVCVLVRHFSLIDFSKTWWLDADKWCQITPSGLPDHSKHRLKQLRLVVQIWNGSRLFLGLNQAFHFNLSRQTSGEGMTKQARRFDASPPLNPTHYRALVTGDWM